MCLPCVSMHTYVPYSNVETTKSGLLVPDMGFGFLPIKLNFKSVIMVGSEQLPATFVLFLQAAFMITDHPAKELQAVTHQALCILVKVH
ncbi:hypothetical protein D5086_022504 [Populus alba]|uniref:Uncharacterized protein n=1 Tax=Populus alba TaxID=43335 RepID=A0ACC4BG65_POPAL